VSSYGNVVIVAGTAFGDWTGQNVAAMKKGDKMSAVAVGIDAATGEELWRWQYVGTYATMPESIAASNSSSVATPNSDGYSSEAFVLAGESQKIHSLRGNGNCHCQCTAEGASGMALACLSPPS
jgi:hypothetical protein